MRAKTSREKLHDEMRDARREQTRSFVVPRVKQSASTIFFAQKRRLVESGEGGGPHCTNVMGDTHRSSPRGQEDEEEVNEVCARRG